MTTTNLNRPFVRRLALAGGLSTLLLLALLALLPAARAFAGDLVRQIGAFTVAPFEAMPAATVAPTDEPPAASDAASAANGAEASALAGFAVRQPSWLPDGYQPDGDWAIVPQGQGVTAVRQYLAGQGEHFLILNQYRYGSGDSYEQTYGDNESVSDVQVRGQQALAISGRLMDHPRDGEAGLVPTNWLMWEEGGINYTLFADDLTIDDLLRIAEKLSQ